ncbi:hypothetical protein JCM19231_2013 [Vibrio ishigakensis]|uniref:Uncharacterized protein n=1 Tax=Vibrio ishigakensis TaxID=1481914 RepID=A0A0B8P5M9_9VIBR|nr:hypothetical protein JCM19231_2013 [Vibrio ishigakensis]
MERRTDYTRYTTNALDAHSLNAEKFGIAKSQSLLVAPFA